MIEFKWDHLQLCSTDAEATAAWFARCLNAEVVRRPDRVDLRLGGINLFITALEKAHPVHVPDGERVQGIDHFGVTVDAGVRACFVRSPGNILVEILERRPAEMTFN
ncbi:VOC family protein [Paraburkholderia hospita]|uniref:VOC family protein n=1 Tax=Paraburkholderia hospita TaxID=169430 RepID=UPI000B348971|nr:VOC family protein [Paraburkholderia hospita]OUL86850.1 glyoxalase [Paraburkholderia hospita]